MGVSVIKFLTDDIARTLRGILYAISGKVKVDFGGVTQPVSLLSSSATLNVQFPSAQSVIADNSSGFFMRDHTASSLKASSMRERITIS